MGMINKQETEFKKRGHYFCAINAGNDVFTQRSFGMGSENRKWGRIKCWWGEKGTLHRNSD